MKEIFSLSERELEAEKVFPQVNRSLRACG